MGRHPDPRPPADAATLGDAATGRPEPRRRSGVASRLMAVVLTAVLGGWAGLAVAGAISANRAAAVAANPPNPSAAAQATPAPSLDPSAVSSPGVAATTEPKPTPRPPIPADEPPSRPAITTVPVGTRLQAELDRMRGRLGIPGLSATVLFRDGSSWTGESGLAVVKGKVPVADDTAFAVGSVSKTYTAALILALAGDGKIDLDAPAAKYLEGRPLDPRITVRMLLDHTSGLDDFFLHGPIDTALQKEPTATWSVRRTLKFVSKPYFPPGTGWHYSNTNYLYLGLIAEAVTGMPLGKALRDRFFGPLGLDGTWYQAAEKPRAPTAHGYRFAGSSRSAAPIDLSDGTGVMPFTSVVTAAGGAGSIATTSADAARWARLLYTGEVLGPEMTAEMLAGTDLTARYRPRVPYGLGVQAFSIDGRPTVGHSGTLLGFRAAVRYLPGESTAVAVLTNQSRADPGRVVQALLRVVFAPEPPCFRCQNPT
jgi:CubicO group peptidase (beta-lactamase class C family)